MPTGQTAPDTASAEPVLPAFGRGCVTDLVPVLLGDVEDAPWIDPAVREARSVVLLVCDGLGWNQIRRHRHRLPTLAGLKGGPITTVAPSTTATALTSIATGEPPGRHGVVGYRIRTAGEILNVLRWATPSGDARRSIVPENLQPDQAFLGHHPPVVTRAEFAGSGFSRAHLAGSRLVGYRTVSTMVVEIGRLVRAGEPFVYAYYDGLDKVGHEYGLDIHHDAELEAIDRLIGDIAESLGRDAALVVTADHGLVDSRDHAVDVDPEVRGLATAESGEARFRWLHVPESRRDELVAAARERHGEQAWVRTADEMIEEGWFGPEVTPAARARLGDVALVARDRWAFTDPADTGPIELVGRHGSVTADEMYVPALTLTT
ncbi:MAG: PglZ domain-containing protein [Actinomyces sp.]|nr:MAG: PglZ domain-containing protein [Actinomyces sp.]